MVDWGRNHHMGAGALGYHYISRLSETFGNGALG